MKIIAWDKITDKAVDPERVPVDGEWCKITDGKLTIKKQYREPVAAPEPEAPVKMRTMGDLINIFPNNTRRKLTAIRDNADYSDPAQEFNGDVASVILSFLTVGDPVDVNGEGFASQSAWLLLQDSLDITQEHIDEIKN